MFDEKNTRKIDETQFTQRDRRADGGARHIRVTRSDVVISRRYSGVAMKIKVPLEAYRGVALDVRATAGGGIAYLITLVHNDADLDIRLAEVRDGETVTAEWKYWASHLGLPRLIVEENGESVDINHGNVIDLAARRRVAALTKHRPRFLARRKPGSPSRMGEVFAGEREIISYE